MAKKITKRIAYQKDFAKKFYDYCCQGYSPARIAFLLGTTRKQLLTWYNDPRYNEFIAAWDRGREAYQAYHEALLDEMITGKRKAAAPAIAAQQYRLRTQFKEDWSDKQESKVTISDESTPEQFTDEQLISQILAKLRKKELLSDLEAHLREELKKDIDKEGKTIN